NGADPTNIQSTVDDADALFAGCGSAIPPIGSCYLAPATTNPYTDALDEYNTGLTPGVPHCGEVQNTTSSWGRLKGLYR
ncbi:MAG: hypothetical protein ACREKH_07565, partial [Candidatus Rokuibacteriota bacterium]